VVDCSIGNDSSDKKGPLPLGGQLTEEASKVDLGEKGEKNVTQRLRKSRN